MDITQYHNKLDNLLESLVDLIEISDPQGQIDIEYQDGILNIELAGGKQFVINEHAPTQQLWMSSPHSGAHHFAYDSMQDKWINTRTEADFMTTLQEDLRVLAGINL